ncbi:hypothetical protein CEXT_670501 [Caerostris extrusa]|uniref:Uncharacterized protein n=1 Tax=Caerostris extrusa TaxID=172846 RepID=A0AAV4PIX6_CAEEX|nr:hypothetical protein CEXT_670501 [Caerostris extrusa]
MARNNSLQCTITVLRQPFDCEYDLPLELFCSNYAHRCNPLLLQFLRLHFRKEAEVAGRILEVNSMPIAVFCHDRYLFYHQVTSNRRSFKENCNERKKDRIMGSGSNNYENSSSDAEEPENHIERRGRKGGSVIELSAMSVWLLRRGE